ncbi:MAG: hypothetical protein M3380_19480 [Chloroflexota bacterium]|nr:hypothetical protein [Chloroflexota bacterium]
MAVPGSADGAGNPPAGGEGRGSALEQLTKLIKASSQALLVCRRIVYLGDIAGVSTAHYHTCRG